MAELAEISPPLVESVDVSDTGFHLPGQTAAHHTDPLTAPVTAGAELLTSLLSLPPRAQKRRRGERFQLDEAQLADEPTTPPAAAENTPMREADEAKQPELPMRERKFECQSQQSLSARFGCRPSACADLVPPLLRVLCPLSPRQTWTTPPTSSCTAGAPPSPRRLSSRCSRCSAT